MKMAMEFNALQIFEIAEQIERNGRKFYTRAAEILKDEKSQKLMLTLAAAEKKHEETFANMRKQISSKQRQLVTFDLDNDASLFVQAIAGAHGFDLRKDVTEQLTGNETSNDVLQMAMKAEKDSIVFYVGLKDFVTTEKGKEQIEEIIQEEKKHLIILNKELQAIEC